MTGTGDRTDGHDTRSAAPLPEPQRDAQRDDAPGDTHVLLVRHGHARAVELGVVAGHAGCAGLSATGRRQAEALRDRLAAAGTRADVVVTSVLPRAIETAETIAPALGMVPTAIPHDCDLCERHPGEGDGLTWDEMVGRYGARDPFRDPDRPMSPGGESGRSFRRRARDRVQRLADEHRGRRIVVVTHGGVILAVTLGFLGLGPRSFAHDLANTSLTEWVRTRDGRWLLHRFNDAAHLEDVHPEDARDDGVAPATRAVARRGHR